MKTRILSAAAMVLLVAACGTDPQERVTGGAAAGAATGAGVGALAGPIGVLAGAAIGGGAGAVTGAVTQPRDLDLGRPIWNNPNTRVPGGARGSAQSSATRDAQRALSSRGFSTGPADGVWGPRSQEAAMAFQRANGIAPTGQPDAATMAALAPRGTMPPMAAAPMMGTAPTPMMGAAPTPMMGTAPMPMMGAAPVPATSPARIAAPQTPPFSGNNTEGGGGDATLPRGTTGTSGNR